MENQNDTIEIENLTETMTETTTEAGDPPSDGVPTLMSEGGETPKEESKDKGPVAWETFMAAVDSEIKALGLEVEVQKNFVQIKHADTAQRIYIAKQAREVTNVPTTLDLGDRPGLSKKFDGSNGKIAATIEPTVDAVRQALQVLASGELGKVRASKRQPKAEKPAEAAPATVTTSEAPAVEA